ncbi:enoyl-CoA hydratase/isomerase family protein [Gammaproteobacteria bacterium]|nr:enoyl-CoA hydratase/isomerase family protein [Gammaproteobacteria bacterium]
MLLQVNRVSQLFGMSIVINEEVDMNLETVKYEKKGAVALITFNRPEVRNAFNAKMTEDILEALLSAKNDVSVRAIVLTGEGLSFSAGADLSARDSKWVDTEAALIEGYLPSLKEIMEMPKPVISAVNGAAAGIGSAYAMACDLTIMSEEAYILQAFSNIGLIPDGGANWFLTNTVGYKLAYQIAIEGERIEAERCLDLGLINKVVSSDVLLDEALLWADKLSLRSSQSLKLTKQIMRKALDSSYEDIYGLEAKTQNTLTGSEDNIEGITAFMEKRQPNFK